MLQAWTPTMLGVDDGPRYTVFEVVAAMTMHDGRGDCQSWLCTLQTTFGWHTRSSTNHSPWPGVCMVQTMAFDSGWVWYELRYRTRAVHGTNKFSRHDCEWCKPRLPAMIVSSANHGHWQWLFTVHSRSLWRLLCSVQTMEANHGCSRWKFIVDEHNF